VNSIEQVTKCPICDSSRLIHCIELIGIPIFCNVLFATREEALRALKGDLKLDVCCHCGHAFNSVFDAKLVNYTEEYDCSLHYSGSFQTFAQQLARELVARYNLYKKTVVEIGCGKGNFIRLLCSLGNNRGIGFDPSYESSEFDCEQVGEFEIIKDYFSDSYTDLEADFICCRHALEHIEHPVEFLSSIRKAVNTNKDTALYFEVPNVLYTFKELAIWDLIYEHCGYFCKQSAEMAFQKSGFSVTRVKASFGDQYLGIEAVPVSYDQDASQTIRLPQEFNSYLSYARTFHSRFNAKLDEWKLRLDIYKQNNKKVVVWGSGSKGVMFLNILNVAENVDYIVDINPNKQNKFTAGTGHQVVSPKFLKIHQPDVVIIMNSVYKNEIINLLEELDTRAEVIVA
jgi:SAM-dependent methyltransferase